jgi:hypothetical protein
MCRELETLCRELEGLRGNSKRCAGSTKWCAGNSKRCAGSAKWCARAAKDCGEVQNGVQEGRNGVQEAQRIAGNREMVRRSDKWCGEPRNENRGIGVATVYATRTPVAKYDRFDGSLHRIVGAPSETHPKGPRARAISASGTPDFCRSGFTPDTSDSSCPVGAALCRDFFLSCRSGFMPRLLRPVRSFDHRGINPLLHHHLHAHVGQALRLPCLSAARVGTGERDICSADWERSQSRSR